MSDLVDIVEILAEERERQVGFEEWQTFKVGDDVTRLGDDRHRIEGFNEAGDLVTVVCIKASAYYALGDREDKCTWRYSYPDDMLIDHQQVIP